ncbi:unnamed protein product [Porites lobata]|uniref:MAM domain-containing protein n=1 Tax=Porites lobata TaxID=104759 RepID=A0ABN8RG83_9CNID|nr:unnamed protein product [Porites lobata]
MCGFLQGINDKFDWTRHKGSTPSTDTGPSFNHTTGNLTGYYMYIEASILRQPGDNAKLYSPPLKFFGNMCLQFDYHMPRATTGSLTVTVTFEAVVGSSYFGHIVIHGLFLTAGSCPYGKFF